MDAQRASRQYQLTLLRLRSAGQSACVYQGKAVHAGQVRDVAVSVLFEAPPEAWTSLERRLDESRMLASLRHPAIVRIEGIARVQGRAAIVWEFVDGIDLHTLEAALEADGRTVPARAAFRIALDTALALEAAYGALPPGGTVPLHAVHGSVTSGNIMLTVDGDVKVLDFGADHAVAPDSPTAVGAPNAAGTATPHSPHKSTSPQEGHAADVYGLGILLLTMLRGRRMPTLPPDGRQRDRVVADAIAALGTGTLPNSEWEDSLAKTLAGMCAAEPERRLSAHQVIPLLRAFEGQATGASLARFAAETVRPRVRAPNGLSDSAALVGAQVSVHLDDDGSVRSPEDRPHPPPAASARPSGSSRTGVLLVGAAALFVFGIAAFALTLATAVGAWWVLSHPAGPASATVTSIDPTAATADGERVVLTADDDTIQWVRLSSLEGTRLISASPVAEGRIAPGTYELSAKAVARQPVTAPWVIATGGARITCARAEAMGTVACSDGTTRRELRP